MCYVVVLNGWLMNLDEKALEVFFKVLVKKEYDYQVFTFSIDWYIVKSVNKTVSIANWKKRMFEYYIRPECTSIRL